MMQTLKAIKFIFTCNPLSKVERLLFSKQFSFDYAIKSHLAWNRRLLDLVEGRLVTSVDIENVGRVDRCELERWINRHGCRRFGELPSFQELCLRHAQFHELVRQIVVLTKDGYVAQARCLLDK